MLITNVLRILKYMKQKLSEFMKEEVNLNGNKISVNMNQIILMMTVINLKPSEVTDTFWIRAEAPLVNYPRYTEKGMACF